MKVYGVVSYDLLEYSPSMFLHRLYATKEAAERELPEDDEFDAYRIEEFDLKTESDPREERTCHLELCNNIRFPFDSFFRCSACGERMQNTPFCPNCGARVERNGGDA